MRSAILVGALVGLATASPVVKRQLIEFDQFDAAPVPALLTPPVDASANPGSYDAAAAADAAADQPITDAQDDSSSSKVKRGACDAQPAGSGPQTSPDTASDFLANPVYPQTANAADVPSGYTLAFSGLNAASQSASYITYKTLTSYDPYACQRACDSNSACYFFNLYMERDPTVSPAAGCANPSSTTNIKCALFGAHLDNTTAINKGQYRQQFQVVIAGSNGYSKLAAPASNPGFQAPVGLPGAINAPDNSYMGYKYFPGPYNPSQCAQACLATSDYDQQHPRADGTWDQCYFFNSYVLSKNGAPQGTYCSMYTKAWGVKYAVNYGQYRGDDHYTVGQSYGWTLSSS